MTDRAEIRPVVPGSGPMWRRAFAEALGTGGLVTVVIGSGIMAERLSPGDVGVQLLENAVATAAGLVVLILVFGPVSGADRLPMASAAGSGVLSRIRSSKMSHMPRVPYAVPSPSLPPSLPPSLSAARRGARTRGVSLIFITAKFKVRPEYADQWPQITADFTAATRGEPGCLWFDWSRSVADPTEYVLVEAFRDDEAGAAHVGSAHFKTARQTLPRHLAETPKIINVTIPQDDWSALGEMAVDQ